MEDKLQATVIGDSSAGGCAFPFPPCPPWVGSNVSGDPTFIVNNQPAHRIGDSGVTACGWGGVYTSVSGSKSFIVSGQPITRIGDGVVCNVCGAGGTHISGQDDFIICE